MSLDHLNPFVPGDPRHAEFVDLIERARLAVREKLNKTFEGRPDNERFVISMLGASISSLLAQSPDVRIATVLAPKADKVKLVSTALRVAADMMDAANAVGGGRIDQLYEEAKRERQPTPPPGPNPSVN